MAELSNAWAPWVPTLLGRAIKAICRNPKSQKPLPDQTILKPLALARVADQQNRTNRAEARESHSGKKRALIIVE